MSEDWYLNCWGLDDDNECVIEFYKLDESGYRFDYNNLEKVRVFLLNFNKSNAKNEKELSVQLNNNDDRFPLLNMNLSTRELRYMLDNYSTARLGDLAIINRKK
jgi:hypothetical protein